MTFNTFGKIAVALLITILILPTVTIAEEKLLPSEALKKVELENRAVLKKMKETENYNRETLAASKRDLAVKYSAKCKTEGLTADEELIYADLLIIADKHEPANKIYKKFAEGTDLNARRACKAMLNQFVKDPKNSLETKREKMNVFRGKFAADRKNDYTGLSFEIFELFNMKEVYTNPELQINLIKDELEWSTVEQPVSAWRKLGELLPLYSKIGKLKEGREYVYGKYAEIEKKKEACTDEKMKGSYNFLLNVADIYIFQDKAIDNPAPALEFTHFYNIEPFKWEDTKGKVVVLDFFTNWCVPCVASFPEMREMQAKYADKGMLMLGVTSFQNSMMHHGEKPVRGISEDEEAKLMHKFIKHQNVTWPIVFGPDVLRDGSYKINGVPTIVVIDKKGNVQKFTHPAYKEELIALIEKLLAE